MASRKEYVANRDASKVYLFDCFARWRSLKEERNLRTDRDVANMLLNEYMARNVEVWYVVKYETVKYLILNVMYVNFFSKSLNSNAETQTENSDVTASETEVPLSSAMPTTPHTITAPGKQLVLRNLNTSIPLKVKVIFLKVL